jgi:hypothetical protein
MELHAGTQKSDEMGLAALVALMGLSFLSLLGLFIALQATTEIRISDNYESHVQARYAALAGINHGRVLSRGLSFDDFLIGPDGTCDPSSAYRNLARSFAFRNPIPWSLARSLSITDPVMDLAGIPDDGLINTGKHGSTSGLVLIPLTGIAFRRTLEGGGVAGITARYFVKFTDNNSESSEIAADPADDPFVDGDGIVLVRSIGIAGTIRENKNNRSTHNSVAMFEARLRRSLTFNLDAPLVIQGSSLQSSSTQMFLGNGFDIQGGESNPGIATIDTELSDFILPADLVRLRLQADQVGNIQGQGLKPSIRDITALVQAHADKNLLLSASYLRSFIKDSVPKFADSLFAGHQNWTEAAVPDLGNFDMALAPSEPSQHPKVTLVDGDLLLSGSAQGAGLLVVTGRLVLSGDFTFNGMILVIGAGDIDVVISGGGIRGGIYVAALANQGEVPAWQTPKLSIGGTTSLRFDRRAIEMALRLIPPLQLGFREITSTIDP